MLSSILTRFGIMSKAAKNIAFWGPDVAEITTLVRTLKAGQYAQSEASVHPFREDITIGGVNIVATVPSSNEGARRSQRQYLAEFDGIVYVVDSTYPDSLSMSKKELESLLSDEEISMAILILVPNPDASGVANEEKLVQELGLAEALGKKDGRVALFAYTLSPELRKGCDEGFQWLVKNLSV